MITEHFSLNELVHSDTAERMQIDNTAPREVVYNLRALASDVLEPIRERWKEPILVNSGYRCPELNFAVGGVSTSYHLKGLAADIRPVNLYDITDFTEVCEGFVTEFNRQYKGISSLKIIPYKTFIHIQYAYGKAKN